MKQTICSRVFLYCLSIVVLMALLVLQDWLNRFSEEEQKANKIQGITRVMNCILGYSHDESMSKNN